MKLSVVIPTFERRDKLRACLESLTAQAGAPAYEVVVVDDGSKDGTREWLSGASGQAWPFGLRVVLQSHRGPAAARNAGVREAIGDLVLFLGDDCIAAPGCLAEHLRAHRAGSDGSVLGFTTWLPSLEITPFMHYQENGGSQFAYGRIEDPEDAGWRFYYTTNISTPRAVLLEHPFEERFPAARYEDMELGWRLQQLGHRVRYWPEALVWHDHPIDFDSFRARCAAYGEYAALFHQLHPEDEGLAVALGVRDAEQADRVFRPGLECAEAVVDAIEPSLGAAPASAFAVRGATALLHDAYRLLIHHEQITGIRKALSLPAPMEA